MNRLLLAPILFLAACDNSNAGNLCAAVTCTASDQCHDVGTCDPVDGKCSDPRKQNDTPCNDGDSCTQTDVCQAGTCFGGNPKTCTASDQCHDVGTCDPGTGACSNPSKQNNTACNDGSSCTQTDTCQSGTCVGGNPKTCTASDQCHDVGTCDPGTGTCSNPSKQNNSTCSDGDSCTQTDTCQSGACVGANPKTCTASDQCHDVGTCDPGTGNCSNPSKMNSSVCNDGNGCTQSDTCQSGACVGANPKTCTASDACHTAGTCDPGTGNCSNPQQPNNTSCDDGTPDTTADVCTNGVCVGGALASSCLELARLNAPATVPSGTHTLTGPRSVYCDMTNDGGGWTALFVGKNGSPNVFDHFDLGTYTGIFVDPVMKYLRRAPANANDGFAELGIACGNTAFVSAPMTERMADYFLRGVQQSWTPFTPKVIAGVIPNVPNTLWAGSGSNYGFVFTRNQGTGASTFASSYDVNSSYNSCNAVADTTSIARVLYRESPLPVPKNTPSTSRPTCRDFIRNSESQGTGYYYLTAVSGPAYLAWCDMTTDSGGWTALIATLNGSVNVFSHIDDTAFTEVCTDPGRRCVRRGPALLSDAAGEIGVSCGAAMVSFALTEKFRTYLQSGIQAGWLAFEPKILAGTVTQAPNSVWTGTNTSDRGIMFARNQTASATFASAYDVNPTWDLCNSVPDQASPWKLTFREVDPQPIRNTQATAQVDCYALRAAGFTLDGRYYITDGSATPYLAHCDMTTAGGGWTTFFAGRNGSPNAFDRFDAPAYAGVCPDPASRCVRRPPSTLGDSASDILASCGNTQVSFATTMPMLRYFTLGLTADWQNITPTVRNGFVSAVPNTMYAGNGGSAGFIFTRNQGTGNAVFASTYPVNTQYDSCANIPDATSFVRLGYRRVSPTPVRNLPGTAGVDCFDLRAQGNTLDGLYWITDGGGAPYLALCDMTTDGGGWTSLFAGRNGSTNVFDHSDAAVYQGICPDPGSKCLRHSTGTLTTTASDLLFKCGTAGVKVGVTNAVRNYFSNGLTSGWATVTPSSVLGTVFNLPDSLWTGVGTDRGFIFARSQTAAMTFSSSYDQSSTWDLCNSVPDQATPTTVSYRRLAPATVRNTLANARFSCRAILDAAESTGDGLYYVTEGGTAHLAYCRMSGGTGGWTAMFSGRNGSTNVFDAFDVGVAAGNCTDPTTRCQRRAPSALANAGGKIAVECGGGLVEFPATAAAASYFVNGLQGAWLALAPTVLAGSVSNVPNTLWSGSGADQGFIFAKNQGGGVNTFGSSYPTNNVYDACNNVPDANSMLRVYYREGP